jgi:uncharacterized protein (DUF58 family)
MAPLASGAELAFPRLLDAGWIAAAAGLGLLAADLVLGGLGGDITGDLSAPPSLPLDGSGEARLSLRLPSARPRRLEAALTFGPRLLAPCAAVAGPAEGVAEARFALAPQRRGEAVFGGAFIRWTGPLRLLWRARVAEGARGIFITAGSAPARAAALRLNERAPQGEKAQIERGRGAEFEALREYGAGQDLRAIDWKRSARHGRLLAKEMRTERNHTVAIAVDCGRQMSEPWGGAPRVDTALATALALAYTSLAGGDRVAFYAFDNEVRLATGDVAGRRAYPALERLTGTVDYSVEATNYTLGLATVAARLPRRSIVVVFTEFADGTGAELMLQAIQRLARTHVVLFVVFRDQELEALTTAPPLQPGDVARAVVAQNLLDARAGVVDRLRRFGAGVVEVDPASMASAVIDAYLDVKRRALV